MDSRLRTAPGPRDWTPGGGFSGFEQPPSAAAQAPREFQPRTFAEPVDRLRGIGPASFLAGAISLAVAYGAITDRLDETDRAHWAMMLCAPIAVITGVIGIAAFDRLGPFNRVTAVMGLALGTLSSVVLAASLAGLLGNSTLIDASQAVSAADLSAERSGVSAAAGTAAFLLSGTLSTTGAYPVTLAIFDGLITTAGGNLQLPEGAHVSYQSDGVSYLLIVVGTHGTVAQIDSLRGTVATGILDG